MNSYYNARNDSDFRKKLDRDRERERENCVYIFFFLQRITFYSITRTNQ